MGNCGKLREVHTHKPTDDLVVAVPYGNAENRPDVEVWKLVRLWGAANSEKYELSASKHQYGA